jgi:hypothetical protein
VIGPISKLGGFTECDRSCKGDRLIANLSNCAATWGVVEESLLRRASGTVICGTFRGCGGDLGIAARGDDGVLSLSAESPSKLVSLPSGCRLSEGAITDAGRP